MFKKNFGNYKNIKFTNVLDNNLYPPEPASKHIPQWYKDTPSYINNEKTFINSIIPHTIKKCIPVFDAITAGYIVFTQVDVEVNKIKNGDSVYSWPSQEPINFHSIEQAKLHPYQNGQTYPKWMNQWLIQTDPGYSCLFINPLHSSNSIFTIMPGIVDTDKYLSRINFPFVLNDSDWTGVIPAGTPIAQVIPFKRDSWKHTFGNQDDAKIDNITFNKLRSTIYNSYKKHFWSKKEYR
jgi:hypothetical protein